MSAVIFPGPPGRVTRVRDTPTSMTIHAPTLVRVADHFSPVNIGSNANSIIEYESHRSLVTGLQVAEGTNHQFLHTLGNQLHVYAFGDRMGRVVVSGLSVASACRVFFQNCDMETPPLGQGASSSDEHGIERVLRFYHENKLSRRRDPLFVAIGRRTVLRGFLTSVAAGVFDDSNRIMQFALTFDTLPQQVN